METSPAIKEYRYKSAEVLNQSSDGTVGYHVKNGIKTYNKNWKPDEDANQRGMIENWLIEQGKWLRYEYGDYFGEIVWRVSIINEVYEHDKSKSIAFMKTFMEYIKLV